MEIPKESGIYKFVCANYVYVGSSCNMYVRYNAHLVRLRAGKHYNNIFNRLFAKYGEGSLTFSILEFCVKELLIEREQYWLDYYRGLNAEKIMNLTEVVNAPMYGKTHTEETKRKISENRTVVHLTDDWKRKISEGNKGTRGSVGRVTSIETKKKLSNAMLGKNAKTFSVVSPNGIVYVRSNISAFAREYGLDRSNLGALINGKRDSYCGWVLYKGEHENDVV